MGSNGLDDKPVRKKRGPYNKPVKPGTITPDEVREILAILGWTNKKLALLLNYAPSTFLHMTHGRERMKVTKNEVILAAMLELEITKEKLAALIKQVQ